MKAKQTIYITIFLALILVLWTGLAFVPGVKEIRLPVVEGVHDLAGLDFDDATYFSTNYWESWPEKLYTPADFAAGTVTQAPVFLEHDDYYRVQYATHRLTLKLTPGRTYGVSMNTSDYAMRLFIDGAEIDSVGVPGATREETVPRTLKKEYYFTPAAEETTLLIQTANFVHRHGAYPPSFYIGSAENIAARAAREAFLSALIFGCLLAMGIDHMSLFVLNRKWKTALLFSVCCVLLALMNRAYLSLFFPNYNWFVAIRFEYFVHFATFFMLTLFLSALFPRLFYKPVIRAYHALCVLFCLTLFFDTQVFTSLLQYFEYASVAMIVYILIRLAWAALRLRKAQNVLAFVGVFGVCFFGVNDMLYHQGIDWLGPIAGQAFTTPIGMVFFAVCCSLLISIEYTETEYAMLAARESETRLTADNEALDHMSRMKSELIATVTHETRTPLAVMSGYAELISMELRKKGVDEQTTADLDSIAEEALRLSAIMDEAQDFAKEKDSGARKAWIRLEDVIGQCARLYEPILARKHTTLKVELPDELPPIFASAGELTQVLFNLLQNARNHTENGKVSVRGELSVENGGLKNEVASVDDEWIEVCVRDTGTGVSPEFLPHAFERGAHDDPNGSGLGLAICRDIVTAHGGRIWMESETGKGTAVFFALPVGREGETDESNGSIG